MDTLLETAVELKDRLPDLLFLLVGDGAARESLETRAQAEGLINIRFVGERPRAEIPEYIAASDVCLVLLRRSDLFKTVLPSKMLEFMACARPVVVSIPGLTRFLVDESGGGISVAPEDHKDLAKAICRFHDEPDLGPKLGENGRRYVLERFTREAKATAYLAALQEFTCL